MPPGLRRMPPTKSQKNLRKSMPQKLAKTASSVSVRQDGMATCTARTNAGSDRDEAAQVMPDQISH